MPDEIADREELLQLLTERARGGSVTAAATLLKELRQEEEPDANSDGFEALDNVTPIRKSA